MHKTLENPLVHLHTPGECDHLILNLLGKENIDVATARSDKHGQLLVADCNASTPQQTRDWYASKPAGAAFLLLSPTQEHLDAMAEICKFTVADAQFAVLYEHTTDDRVHVSALGYTTVKEDEKPDVEIEPTVSNKSTNSFLEAVRRSFDGPLTVTQSGPSDFPPTGMIGSTGTVRKVTSTIFANGYGSNKVSNTSDTLLNVYYTIYLMLQQQNNGTQNSQVMIIQTEWNIAAGGLYSNTSSDRGNAQCNMEGTLQPDPDNSSFFVSAPPNGFSPVSGSGSFDASVNETIYYYSKNQNQTYNFNASTTYTIDNWSVASISSGTKLGPNFYALQPTNCETRPSSANDAFNHNNQVNSLTDASVGSLVFYTYSSWQTNPGHLVPGKLRIYSKWDANVYRWHHEGKYNYQQDAVYRMRPDFYVNFTDIQPPG